MPALQVACTGSDHEEFDARHGSAALVNVNRVPEGIADARRAVALAREMGFLAGEALALADMGQRAGRIPEAGTRLREALELTARMGDPLGLLDCLDTCGHLCAATQRWAEAVTVWAAYDAQSQTHGFTDLPQDAQRRDAPLRQARQALGPGGTRAAERRGAAMTAATAAELVTMLTAAGPPEAPAAARLSRRERELVTLVAQGCTNAQIAARLYISARTVTSHLDRIRDKTGCRRRADLTRLALQTGLV